MSSIQLHVYHGQHKLLPWDNDVHFVPNSASSLKQQSTCGFTRARSRSDILFWFGANQSLFLLFLDNLVVVLVFLTLQDKHSVPIWIPRKEDCWLTNSCLLAINIDHSFANSIMMTHLNNNSILTRLFPLSLITKAKYCRQLHKIKMAGKVACI